MAGRGDGREGDEKGGEDEVCSCLMDFPAADGAGREVLAFGRPLEILSARHPEEVGPVLDQAEARAWVSARFLGASQPRTNGPALVVLANLSGHDSHGVGMIPQYAGFLRGGGLLANQHARVTGDFGSMLMVDGCRGYGQVIGHEAMQLGIGRAQRDGLALVALRNSHDNFVMPQDSQRFPGARDVELPALGHLAVLFSGRAAEALLEALRAPASSS